jgi:superfamily II DNA or RNA helicase
LSEKLRIGRRDVPPDTAEVIRVTGLPVVNPLLSFNHEQINREVLQVDVFNSGWRLFPIQAAALQSYRNTGGLFAPIGVGQGKTAITLLIADHAYKKLGVRRSVILVPPQVYDQLFKRDIPWARKRMALGVQFFPMAGKSQSQRAKSVEKGLLGCYILPYSLLSTSDSIYLLESLEPGLIIADEAHLLKNRTSARTKRVLNYIRDHNPQLVCLSGTITSKGINDYSHLIRYCLGENCPLPRSPIMCQEWGAAIDSAETPPSEAQMKVMLPLLD